MVSHELRSPLGVISSSNFYLQKMLNGSNEKVKKHLKRIEEQVFMCDSIVNDLLEYIRGQHPEINEEEFNPFIEQVEVHLRDGGCIGPL